MVGISGMLLYTDTNEVLALGTTHEVVATSLGKHPIDGRIIGMEFVRSPNLEYFGFRLTKQSLDPPV